MGERCEVPACPQPARARGMCSTHHNRERKVRQGVDFVRVTPELLAKLYLNAPLELQAHVEDELGETMCTSLVNRLDGVRKLEPNRRAVILDEFEWLLSGGELPAVAAKRCGVSLETIRSYYRIEGRGLPRVMIPPAPAPVSAEQVSRIGSGRKDARNSGYRRWGGL